MVVTGEVVVAHSAWETITNSKVADTLQPLVVWAAVPR